MLENLPPGLPLDSGPVQGWFQKLLKAINSPTVSSYSIIDSPTHGLIIRSPNLHYWGLTISNAGTVTWTDLGLNKPHYP
jgi:hypothetical protein